jgi:hypothetical protein
MRPLLSLLIHPILEGASAPATFYEKVTVSNEKERKEKNTRELFVK